LHFTRLVSALQRRFCLQLRVFTALLSIDYDGGSFANLRRFAISLGFVTRNNAIQ
jgi:hypothetical protein